MEKLLKLTNEDGDTILIGVDSIIDVTIDKYKPLTTKIRSRGAMVETNFVKESPSEIYKLYQKSCGK
jgi:hypothetical protein